ncbi:MAG: hypothetical protein ACR2MN_11460 [Acidimicrobiales bacterium]
MRAQGGRPGPAAGPLTVQRKKGETKASLAKITGSGLGVKNAPGNQGQLGHAMDVWVQIDAGSHPVTPAGAPPNSVYGLELEYWEHVKVARDNQGAKGEKPWNDIHAMKPDASTFEAAADGCALTWKEAVAQAAAGTLKGKKKVGFRDIPGLFERAGRNVSRTLDFRIIFDDGTDRRVQTFATQVLEVKNGRLSRSAYRDSTGNNLASGGFAGGDAVGTPSDRTLGDDALPTMQGITNSVPREARDALDAFLAEAVGPTAAPYVDLELPQFLATVAKDKQSAAAQAWLDGIAHGARGDVAGGVAAGQFLIPSIAGTKAVQKKLPSGGLLVALVTQNRVRRVYYTSNRARTIDMKAIKNLENKTEKIRLRSFAEIPVERSVEAPKAPKVVALSEEVNATFLRKFEAQGRNHAVKVDAKTGKRIKPGQNVSVLQPEQRDVTGEWVKAEFAGTTGFIRAAKLTEARSAEGWNRAERGDARAATGAESMRAYFEDQFRAQGAGYKVYSKLLASFPGLETDLAATHTKVFGEAESLKMELDRETAANTGERQQLRSMARRAATTSEPQKAMVRRVARYVKARPGQGDMLESTYNQHVPPLGLAVPATLGEIIHQPSWTCSARTGTATPSTTAWRRTSQTSPTASSPRTGRSTARTRCRGC